MGKKRHFIYRPLDRHQAEIRKYFEAGLTHEALAKKYNVTRVTITRFLEKWRPKWEKMDKHPEMTINKVNANVTIPARFVPKFWEECDGRSTITRSMKKRYDDLSAAINANSPQKDILVQRLTFLSVFIETMEINAAQTGELEIGKYVVAVNVLVNLMRTLGLEKYTKKVGSLKAYLQERAS